MEAFTPEEQRLFEDPVIVDFLPALMRLAVRSRWARQRFTALLDQSSPGIRGAILCRTRFIDDAVANALAAGMNAVVILGAGLDSRPYRLPGIAEKLVFEVDLPTVQAYKKQCLARRFGMLPKHVQFAPSDFNADQLETTLERAGLASQERAVFVWEGVTQYLQPEAVDAVLRAIASRPKESELVFTYVLEEAITGRFHAGRSEAFRKGAGRQPEPWYFGIAPSRLEAFLRERKLTLCEDRGSEEHLARYVRPLGRDLLVSEIERVARARV
jgi:methyltransferase (TIGR00027 family)